jgi:hypothetical protein
MLASQDGQALVWAGSDAPLLSTHHVHGMPSGLYTETRLCLQLVFTDCLLLIAAICGAELTSGALYTAVVILFTRSVRPRKSLLPGTMSMVCALPKSHSTQRPLDDCRMFSPFRSLNEQAFTSSGKSAGAKLTAYCSGEMPLKAGTSGFV